MSPTPVFQLRLGRLTVRSERGHIRDRLQWWAQQITVLTLVLDDRGTLNKLQLLMHTALGGRDGFDYSIDASLYLTWLAEIG